MECDITLIVTIIGTTVAIIGSNIALISWLRSDMKAFEQEVRVWREDKSFEREVRGWREDKSFEREVRGWREDINKEIKDFHGRLCSIDERIRTPKTNP